MITPRRVRVALALMVAAAAANAQPDTQGPPRELLDAVRAAIAEPDPGARARRVKQLCRSHKKSIAEWESLLEAMPRPLLPLSPAPDGLQTHSARLWCGREEGVLETKLTLFVPSSLDATKPAPLLIVSHGSGGHSSGEVVMWREIAERARVMVLGADEQGENRGYASTDRERWTPVSLVRWAKLHLNVDCDRVFLSGTSRGGHITWAAATHHPDLWAGVVPMIGGPTFGSRTGGNNIRLVRNLLDVPLRDLQGAKDDPGLIFNLDLAFERLKDARDAKYLKFEHLGHSFDLSAVDWVEFFTTKTRPPAPTRIRFWCATPDYGRCAWIELKSLARDVTEAYTPKVKAAVWNAMDNDARKRWVAEDTDKHTASIDVRIQGGASERTVVVQHAFKVKELRLLLPRSLWPAGDDKAVLHVEVQGSKRKLAPRPSVETFLLDWCDRLDLRAAPVVVANVRL